MFYIVGTTGGMSESNAVLVLMLQAFVVFWVGGMVDAGLAAAADESQRGLAATIATGMAQWTLAMLIGTIGFFILFAAASFQV